MRAVAASTGCASIAVDPRGENAIAVGSGANRETRDGQVEDALLGPDTTLVLQMEVQAETNAALIARARAAGCRVVLNLAPAAALPEAALRAVDVLVVNETEGAWLASALGCEASAADLASRLGGLAVVLTLGADGADIAGGAGIAGRGGAWHQPAVAVRAVDTTAAGDCFVGVLASRLDRGALLPEAIERAAKAAALCCLRPGSQGSIPTAAETDAFMPG